MKKMILLCTMICVGQLYGMNADQIINNIKNSALYQNAVKENDLGNFTKVIAVATTKIPNLSREEIAKKFNSPIAQKYIEMNTRVQNAILAQHPDNTLEELAKNIDRIDTNYNSRSSNNFWTSNLSFAYLRALNQGDKYPGTVKVVEFFLKNKANPNLRYGESGTIMNEAAVAAEKRQKLGQSDFGLYRLLREYLK